MNDHVGSEFDDLDITDEENPTEGMSGDAQDMDIEDLSKVYTCWQAHSDGSFSPSTPTALQIPAASYQCDADQSGNIFFVPKDVVTDDLVLMPTMEATEILKDIEGFWQRKDVFHDCGFLWKRGILLYGPAGSGKTTCVNLLAHQIINASGIVVYMQNPSVDIDALKLLRATESDLPILYIMEDIDSAIAEWGEKLILSLLDGDAQVDNIVFVATTNYPEDLPDRITDRPSRFDVIRKIEYPDEDSRLSFLSVKNARLTADENAAELRKWLDGTEGYTYSHIKEVIILVECLGNTLEYALHHMDNMRKGIVDVDQYPQGHKTQSFGFIEKDT